MQFVQHVSPKTWPQRDANEISVNLGVEMCGNVLITTNTTAMPTQKLNLTIIIMLALISPTPPSTPS